MSKITLGFDIGTGLIKIAQNGKNSVESLVAEPIPENLVREGHIVSYEAMADFIKETTKRNRIRGGSCAVVLPAGEAFLRRVTMPLMPVDQLEYNLPYEFRDYVEQGKDKFFYDYAVIKISEGDEEQPGEMHLLAAAVPKETIAEYRMMFHRAGFKMKIAAPAECAYGNLIAGFEERDADHKHEEYCIIDLGHAATRIYIYTGQSFETSRVIETGAADIDHAIATARTVDEHIARTHKEANHESALDLEEVRDVCEGIALEVMKAINFYSFNNRESNLEHAYFCGGSARIKPLIEAVQQTTGLITHPITELLPLREENGAEHSDVCAAAIGITMQ